MVTDTLSPDDEHVVTPPRCPRCWGWIPNNDQPGAYSGAWSRKFRKHEHKSDISELTYVCSQCGSEEAMLQFMGFDLRNEFWPVVQLVAARGILA